MTKKKKNLFQMDLIKNKYHIFNSENAKKKGYYPTKLLQMIEELPNFEKKFNIEIGEIYTVRAFFAISKPIEICNGLDEIALAKDKSIK